MPPSIINWHLMEQLDHITSVLEQVHQQTLRLAAQQVNHALTLRNWLFGYHLREFELGGQRAGYGEATLKDIAQRLSRRGVKGMSHSALYRFMQFFDYYPQIYVTLSQKFGVADGDHQKISATVSRKLGTGTERGQGQWADPHSGISAELLVTRLSYSHFLELLKVDDPLKRAYYELSAIKGSWTVRELRRAITTLMFERSGMSAKKELAPLATENQGEAVQTASLIRNPLVLEFLDLAERPEFTESDLEQAIIHHLQSFLIELGRGFCFEARQKRITFDNTHYYIDLVFYHRILKCHVLIDLKLGAFDHADAGQMNLYLNYFSENEREESDNPPVGIVLCAEKNDALVHYATGGMSRDLFVGKYMLQLPSVDELRQLVISETEKLNRA